MALKTFPVNTLFSSCTTKKRKQTGAETDETDQSTKASELRPKGADRWPLGAPMVVGSGLLRSLLLGIPIGLTFFDSVGYVARVEGVSMQPTFNPDTGSSSDFVYLDRLPLRNYSFEKGDVVSLISPKNRREVLIKRVVGLEGDLVVTKRYKKPLVRVPKGHCWVEGDNAGRSMDSNEFGPISLGLVTAKATFILWPLSRCRHLSTADVPQAIYSYWIIWKSKIHNHESCMLHREKGDWFPRYLFVFYD